MPIANHRGKSDIAHLQNDLKLLLIQPYVLARIPIIASMPDAPDGKSYVDAALSAGRRSRARIYFMLILAVLTFVSIRNTYSIDWPRQEYQVYEELLDCYVDSNCESWDRRLKAVALMPRDANEEQKIAKRREVERDLHADFENLRPVKGGSAAAAAADSSSIPTNMNQSNYEAFIGVLQKRDVDNDTITIPILGSAVNINDLWLVSGALMFFLLYFLRTSLEQEYRSIGYIIKYKPEFATLAVMNQVLTPDSIQGGYFGRFVELCIGLTPSMLYSYLCYIDWQSLFAKVIDVGPERTYVEFAFECALVLTVFYINVRCLLVQAKIRHMIRPILIASTR